ncbi:MAG: hypothetical protein HYW25_03685 [Candidatus Aenigmarchaeota archaeon]|nr:hypothetical protein [Candidatus Aenigmarchaeota archaeon]
MKYSLLFILLIASAGCIGQVIPLETGGEGIRIPEIQQPEEDIYEPPEGTPSIRIISPADGAILEGTIAVGIEVEVQNFRLSGAAKELRQNEGQIFAALVGPVPKSQYSPYTTFSFTGIEPGTYTLVVELVDNQKNSLGFSDTASITVSE